MHPSFRHLFLLVALSGPASAQLTIPGDGSDGVFAPIADVEVDLSLAVTGAWDADNTANAGKGVYDPTKWAVIFKYASVNIPVGVTVKFKNHPSRAPVVWLVQGDVHVTGTIDLTGKPASNDSIQRMIPAEPGPGGFRGGVSTPAGNSDGFGIGGGAGARYSGSYGNIKILPLIGGSGGHANGGDGSGEGGGGAMLIATPGEFQLGGILRSSFPNTPLNVYRGSGGAFRIIADHLTGNGEINCLGTSGGITNGRIRLETLSMSPDLRTFPETINVHPPSIPEIWPPATAPTVLIHSVDGEVAPTDPRALFANGSDTQISRNTAVEVIVKTTNFPIEGTVYVRTMGKTNGGATWHALTYDSGNFSEALWKASLVFPAGYSALQAHATMP